MRMINLSTLINILRRQGTLRKTETGYDVAIPNFKATDLQTFVWNQHDGSAAALALLKNCTE